MLLGQRVGGAAVPGAELSKLPMLFEPNAGQVEPSARFVAHSAGGTFLFGEAGVTLNLLSAPVPNGKAGSLNVGLRFEDSSPRVQLVAGKGASGKVNYLLGSDPTRWRTGLATFSEVRYNGLYPGVDLSYEGTGGFLKGTYTVAPGTDPTAIRWRYTGAENLTLSAGGDLEIALNGQSEEAALTEQAPIAWQETTRGRVPVEVSYKLLPGGSVGFNVGAYDPARPLVIDPTITYATYFGGVGDDTVTDMAVDTAGSIYVTGNTTSFNLPLQSPFQGQIVQPQPYVADAFVMKLNPVGNEVVYATYLGGTEHDGANGIAVDAAGNAYVTGFTRSTDFPTRNPIQKATRGTQDDYFDVFVTELDNTGTALVYSTYLGHYGDERGYGIAVDGSGSAYITGETTVSDYVTKNPIQPHNFGFTDAFVTKLSPLGKEVVYSTFLGGKELDRGVRIKVDGAGNAYVAGSTESDNFPTKNALQPQIGGAADVFIAKLNPQGSALVYSTYYGGSGNDARIFFGIMLGMALDWAGNVYFTGWTESADLPTRNPIQPHITLHTNQPTGIDAFVAELDATGGALVYATYLGGKSNDYGFGIAVDEAGNAFATGQTSSPDFPGLDSAGRKPNDYDAYLVEIKAGGSEILYSTVLGGLLWDEGHSVAVRAGSVYVAGSSRSLDFPTTKDAPQPTHHGAEAEDVFVARLSGMPNSPTTAPVISPLPVVNAVPGTGSRLFQQTGKRVGGLFLDFWNKNGGLPQQGYPISGPIGELSELDGRPYTVQYFERAVFEYHPEKPEPFRVLLSQLGTFQYARKYPDGAPNQKANTSGRLFPETGHWVGGRFLDYWQRNGGLAQQGYPVSEEFTEVSDLNGKAYTVQYFERAVFEYHPENQPPNDVLLSQLGTFSYRARYGNR